MVEAARIPAGPKVREWSRKRGYSDWMVARFVKIAQESGVSTNHFLEGLGKRPPSYVRANPLRSDRNELRKRWEARGFELADVDLDPQMMRVIQAPISPGATLEHLLGHSMPQDAASAAAPLALGARPGDVVVDLAAAPGVKSVHLAGDVGHGALVAVEPDAERMRALRANLERCGAPAMTRAHTAQETPGEAWADRVMVDAPCTGEGTIPKDRNRRRGDAKEIGTLAREQAAILEAADRILKPGGTLVYATCTFAPEENEAQVQHLLDMGYRMERLPFDAFGAPLGRGITQWPGLELDTDVAHARRFFPGVHATLGFFVAKLTKEGA